MPQLEPQFLSLDYARFRPKCCKENLSICLMFLAIVAAFAELPWIALIARYLQRSTDITERFNILHDGLMLLPSLTAWILSTFAYYILCRRTSGSMLTVHSLVLFYAILLIVLKYMTCRSWNCP